MAQAVDAKHGKNGGWQGLSQIRVMKGGVGRLDEKTKKGRKRVRMVAAAQTPIVMASSKKVMKESLLFG